MKAVFHRGQRQLLELIRACALKEEIGIAADVLDTRKADRIHPFLDDGMPGSREFGDPMSERPYEIANLVAGQRSIDPAVTFSQIGVVVLRAQHDFERSRAAHQSGEMLCASGARNHSERGLKLTEDR